MLPSHAMEYSIRCFVGVYVEASECTAAGSSDGLNGGLAGTGANPLDDPGARRDDGSFACRVRCSCNKLQCKHVGHSMSYEPTYLRL